MRLHSSDKEADDRGGNSEMLLKCVQAESEEIFHLTSLMLDRQQHSLQ